MRPIERGPWPKDAEGRPRVFEDYEEARPFLIDNIGDCCSFCEIHLGASLAVEHLRHKDGNDDLRIDWTNFLLACSNCNSNKGTKVGTPDDLEARLWPHLHRTFDVFVYGAGGRVRLADIDEPDLAKRAGATADMVKLFRWPGEGLARDQDNTASDRRWLKRMQAWDEATAARDDLRLNDSPEMRRMVVRLARAKGFWSVWMTVFADDPELLRALCTEYPGTAVERVFPLPPHCRARPEAEP